MNRMLTITLGICTLVATADAQVPTRRPGAEQTRMAFFAGHWKFEGAADGLKFTRNETCEWFAGGFHLVCQAEGSGDLGPLKDQSVFAYDRAAKSYTFHSITSLGNSLFARGTVTDSVWTWTTDLAGDKGPFNARLIVTEQLPTAYAYKLEGLLGGAWVVLEEGRATKVR